jgi:hypothetical protein
MRPIGSDQYDAMDVDLAPRAILAVTRNEFMERLRIFEVVDDGPNGRPSIVAIRGRQGKVSLECSAGGARSGKFEMHCRFVEGKETTLRVPFDALRDAVVHAQGEEVLLLFSTEPGALTLKSSEGDCTLVARVPTLAPSTPVF